MLWFILKIILSVVAFLVVLSLILGLVSGLLGGSFLPSLDLPSILGSLPLGTDDGDDIKDHKRSKKEKKQSEDTLTNDAETLRAESDFLLYSQNDINGNSRNGLYGESDLYGSPVLSDLYEEFDDSSIVTSEFDEDIHLKAKCSLKRNPKDNNSFKPTESGSFSANGTVSDNQPKKKTSKNDIDNSSIYKDDKNRLQASIKTKGSSLLPKFNLNNDPPALRILHSWNFLSRFMHPLKNRTKNNSYLKVGHKKNKNREMTYNQLINELSPKSYHNSRSNFTKESQPLPSQNFVKFRNYLRRYHSSNQLSSNKGFLNYMGNFIFLENLQKSGSTSRFLHCLFKQFSIIFYISKQTDISDSPAEKDDEIFKLDTTTHSKRFTFSNRDNCVQKSYMKKYADTIEIEHLFEEKNKDRHFNHFYHSNQHYYINMKYIVGGHKSTLDINSDLKSLLRLIIIEFRRYKTVHKIFNPARFIEAIFVDLLSTISKNEKVEKLRCQNSKFLNSTIRILNIYNGIESFDIQETGRDFHVKSRKRRRCEEIRSSMTFTSDCRKRVLTIFKEDIKACYDRFKAVIKNFFPQKYNFIPENSIQACWNGLRRGFKKFSLKRYNYMLEFFLFMLYGSDLFPASSTVDITDKLSEILSKKDRHHFYMNYSQKNNKNPDVYYQNSKKRKLSAENTQLQTASRIKLQISQKMPLDVVQKAHLYINKQKMSNNRTYDFTEPTEMEWIKIPRPKNGSNTVYDAHSIIKEAKTTRTSSKIFKSILDQVLPTKKKTNFPILSLNGTQKCLNGLEYLIKKEKPSFIKTRYIQKIAKHAKHLVWILVGQGNREFRKSFLTPNSLLNNESQDLNRSNAVITKEVIGIKYMGISNDPPTAHTRKIIFPNNDEVYRSPETNRIALNTAAKKRNRYVNLALPMKVLRKTFKKSNLMKTRSKISNLHTKPQQHYLHQLIRLKTHRIPRPDRVNGSYFSKTNKTHVVQETGSAPISVSMIRNKHDKKATLYNDQISLKRTNSESKLKQPFFSKKSGSDMQKHKFFLINTIRKKLDDHRVQFNNLRRDLTVGKRNETMSTETKNTLRELSKVSFDPISTLHQKPTEISSVENRGLFNSKHGNKTKDIDQKKVQDRDYCIHSTINDLTPKTHVYSKTDNIYSTDDLIDLSKTQSDMLKPLKNQNQTTEIKSEELGKQSEEDQKLEHHEQSFTENSDDLTQSSRNGKNVHNSYFQHSLKEKGIIYTEKSGGDRSDINPSGFGRSKNLDALFEKNNLGLIQKSKETPANSSNIFLKDSKHSLINHRFQNEDYQKKTNNQLDRKNGSESKKTSDFEQDWEITDLDIYHPKNRDLSRDEEIDSKTTGRNIPHSIIKDLSRKNKIIPNTNSQAKNVDSESIEKFEKTFRKLNSDLSTNQRSHTAQSDQFKPISEHKQALSTPEDSFLDNMLNNLEDTKCVSLFDSVISRLKNTPKSFAFSNLKSKNKLQKGNLMHRKKILLKQNANRSRRTTVYKFDGGNLKDIPIHKFRSTLNETPNSVDSKTALLLDDNKNFVKVPNNKNTLKRIRNTKNNLSNIKKDLKDNINITDSLTTGNTFGSELKNVSSSKLSSSDKFKKYTDQSPNHSFPARGSNGTLKKKNSRLIRLRNSSHGNIPIISSFKVQLRSLGSKLCRPLVQLCKNFTPSFFYNDTNNNLALKSQKVEDANYSATRNLDSKLKPAASSIIIPQKVSNLTVQNHLAMMNASPQQKSHQGRYKDRTPIKKSSIDLKTHENTSRSDLMNQNNDFDDQGAQNIRNKIPSESLQKNINNLSSHKQRSKVFLTDPFNFLKHTRIPLKVKKISRYERNSPHDLSQKVKISDSISYELIKNSDRGNLKTRLKYIGDRVDFVEPYQYSELDVSELLFKSPGGFKPKNCKLANYARKCNNIFMKSGLYHINEQKNSKFAKNIPSPLNDQKESAENLEDLRSKETTREPNSNKSITDGIYHREKHVNKKESSNKFPSKMHNKPEKLKSINLDRSANLQKLSKHKSLDNKSNDQLESVKPKRGEYSSKHVDRLTESTIGRTNNLRKSCLSTHSDETNDCIDLKDADLCRDKTESHPRPELTDQAMDPLENKKMVEFNPQNSRNPITSSEIFKKNNSAQHTHLNVEDAEKAPVTNSIKKPGFSDPEIRGKKGSQLPIQSIDSGLRVPELSEIHKDKISENPELQTTNHEIISKNNSLIDDSKFKKDSSQSEKTETLLKGSEGIQDIGINNDYLQHRKTETSSKESTVVQSDKTLDDGITRHEETKEPRTEKLERMNIKFADRTLQPDLSDLALYADLKSKTDYNIPPSTRDVIGEEKNTPIIDSGTEPTPSENNILKKNYDENDKSKPEYSDYHIKNTPDGDKITSHDQMSDPYTQKPTNNSMFVYDSNGAENIITTSKDLKIPENERNTFEKSDLGPSSESQHFDEKSAIIGKETHNINNEEMQRVHGSSNSTFNEDKMPFYEMKGSSINLQGLKHDESALNNPLTRDFELSASKASSDPSIDASSRYDQFIEQLDKIKKDNKVDSKACKNDPKSGYQEVGGNYNPRDTNSSNKEGREEKSTAYNRENSAANNTEDKQIKKFDSKPDKEKLVQDSCKENRYVHSDSMESILNSCDVVHDKSSIPQDNEFLSELIKVTENDGIDTVLAKSDLVSPEKTTSRVISGLDDCKYIDKEELRSGIEDIQDPDALNSAAETAIQFDKNKKIDKQIESEPNVTDFESENKHPETDILKAEYPNNALSFDINNMETDSDSEFTGFEDTNIIKSKLDNISQNSVLLDNMNNPVKNDSKLSEDKNMFHDRLPDRENSKIEFGELNNIGKINKRSIDYSKKSSTYARPGQPAKIDINELKPEEKNTCRGAHNLPMNFFIDREIFVDDSKKEKKNDSFSLFERISPKKDKMMPLRAQDLIKMPSIRNSTVSNFFKRSNDWIKEKFGSLSNVMAAKSRSNSLSNPKIKDHSYFTNSTNTLNSTQYNKLSNDIDFDNKDIVKASPVDISNSIYDYNKIIQEDEEATSYSPKKERSQIELPLLTINPPRQERKTHDDISVKNPSLQHYNSFFDDEYSEPRNDSADSTFLNAHTASENIEESDSFDPLSIYSKGKQLKQNNTNHNFNRHQFVKTPAQKMKYLSDYENNRKDAPKNFYADQNTHLSRKDPAFYTEPGGGDLNGNQRTFQDIHPESGPPKDKTKTLDHPYASNNDISNTEILKRNIGNFSRLPEKQRVYSEVSNPQSSVRNFRVSDGKNGISTRNTAFLKNNHPILKNPDTKYGKLLKKRLFSIKNLHKNSLKKGKLTKSNSLFSSRLYPLKHRQYADISSKNPLHNTVKHKHNFLKLKEKSPIRSNINRNEFKLRKHNRKIRNHELKHKGIHKSRFLNRKSPASEKLNEHYKERFQKDYEIQVQKSPDPKFCAHEIITKIPQTSKSVEDMQHERQVHPTFRRGARIQLFKHQGMSLKEFD